MVTQKVSRVSQVSQGPPHSDELMLHSQRGLQAELAARLGVSRLEAKEELPPREDLRSGLENPTRMRDSLLSSGESS